LRKYFLTWVRYGSCPSIQKLIEMKEAVGRPEDIEDVRKLKQILGKLEKKYYE